MNNVIELFPQKPEEEKSAYQQMIDWLTNADLSDEQISRIMGRVRAESFECAGLFSEEPLRITVTDDALADQSKLIEEILEKTGAIIGRLMKTSVFFAAAEDIYREENAKLRAMAD